MQVKSYLVSFRFGLLSLLLLLCAGSAMGQCVPAYSSGCTFLDDIHTFTLNGANATAINQPNTGCSPGAYIDYGAGPNPGVTTVQLFQSLTYNGTINSEYSGEEYVRIWIDFNNDNTFAASEAVGTVSNIGNALVPFSITIPITANPGVHKMRVRMAYYEQNPSLIDPCTSYSFGETHDYRVEILALPACSGTPLAGTASATPNPVCPNVPFTLTTVGATAASNMTYNWQSAPSATGPWTNITGATGFSYTVTAGITTATFYRFKDSCNTSGTAATSNVVAVTMNSFINCYCSTSTANYSGDNDIGQVTVGNFSNPTAAPTPLVNNPASNALYTNYTALPPITINAGIPTPMSVTQIEAFSTWYQTYTKAWIDYDHSGTFDANELVLGGSSISNSPASPTVTSTFTLPVASVQTGLTRMRVVMVEGGTASSVQPCGTYNWGETEDYTVNIVIPPACTGTPTAGTAAATPNPVCPNTAFTLKTTGASTALNLYYQWQSAPSPTGPWTDITGANSTVHTVASGITAVTYYRFKDSCINAGVAAYSNVITVNLNNFLTCYCNTSTATSTGDDDIGQVTVGTFANPAAPPTPLTNNPAANALYTNFTALGPIQLVAGVSTPMSVTQFNSYSTWYQTYTKAWIDYNHSGTFEASEVVLSGSSTANTPISPTVTANFTAPLTALAGLTRMRVVMVEGGSSTSFGPCDSYSWGETEDYTVNIIAPPTLVTNSPVCAGGTLTITASSPLGNPSYTLTGPGISAMTNTTGVFTIPNMGTATAGTYNVTVTSGGLTSQARTTAVVVNPPTPITAGTITAPTACGAGNGSFVVNGLANNTVYTVSFNRNNIPQPTLTVTSNGSGTATVTGLSEAIYTNVVFTSSAGCLSVPLGPLVVPSPTQPPAPVASYNAPLCPGSGLVLTVNPTVPGGIYTWTGPTNFAATGSSVSRSNMSFADSGNYNVTLTTPDNCVSAITTIKVVVNTPPAAPTVSNLSYCQFETPQPLTATGTSLRWYLTATGGTGSSVAPTPSTQLAGPQLFYVTQTNGFGCEGPRALITVTIKPKPQPPGVNTPTQLCQYEVTGALTATGTALKWYATPTATAPLAAAPTPVTTIPGTFNFYVSQTVNGCESDRAQIVVVVKPKPAPPVVQSPFNLCQGDPPAPLPVIGQNLLWYTTPTGGVGSPVNPVPPTGFEDSFAYYVSQTVDGCESDRALLKIFINYRPNGLIIASKEFVCEGDTISFNYFGNARPDAQFNWKTPNPGTVIESGAGTPGPLVVRYNDSGNSYVRLVVNNRGCLSDELELPVKVRSQPDAIISLKDDACIGEVVTVALGGVTPDIQYYNWNFDGADIRYNTADAGPYGLTYSTPGTKVIQLFATRNGCTNFQPITDTITVHDYPIASILAQDNANICAGDEVVIRAEQGFDQVAGVNLPYSYSWRPEKYFGTDSGGTHAPIVRAKLERSTPIFLTVTNAWGCVATDSQNIEVGPCCEMVFPDAFTPNGDNRNDYFRPISAGRHRIATFRVVNRWGNVVYETTAAGNGWDGTYRGQPQGMDTYFYYVRYQCNTGEYIEKQGQVILVR